jgi:acid phosphatase type 7
MLIPMIKRAVLLWLIVSFALPLGATQVLRGPYLQNGTPQSVSIKWRTDEAAESIVRYGTNLDDLSDLRGNLVATTNHEVRVTGLLPDQRYFYSIGTLGEALAGGDEHHYFVTPPLPGTPKPIRIWAIGDCGTASRYWLPDPGSPKVRDGYLNFAGTNHTDVWLMLGDNAYDAGTDDEYQRAVFQIYPTLLRNTMLWSTLGNHETYGPDLEGRIAYHDIFTLPSNAEAGGAISGTENYYSFDYGNVHFVCLDSELSDRSTNGPMATWLYADLAANTNDWVIAFWHSPPYSKGSHDSDNMFDNFGNMTFMRTNFVSILESYGVDLVLCGHSHAYERSFLINGHYGFSDSLVPEMIKDAGSGRPEDTGAYRKSLGPAGNEGAVYVVAGSSGHATFLQRTPHPAMFVSLLRMGSMVIDISGNRLDAKFLRETGAIDDHFTILKGKPAEPLRIARVRVDEGQVTVGWKSRADGKYRVEQATNLENPMWEIASPDITATGATTFWTGTAEPDARVFFRVVEVQ